MLLAMLMGRYRMVHIELDNKLRLQVFVEFISARPLPLVLFHTDI